MTDKEMGYWQTFASDFGDEISTLLGEQVSQGWTVQVAPDEGANTAPLSQVQIYFEGSLRGTCDVAFDPGAVSGFAPAGDTTEAEPLVLDLLTRTATQFCSRRAATYGVSRASGRIGKATAGSQASLTLVLTPGEGAAISLHLSADTQFLQALSVKRASEDSAQLAAVQSLFEMLPDPGNLDVVMDVELDVTLRFGQRHLTLREVLDLTSGSVVELDRQVDEPVELLLDGKVIARGEAVVIDGNYGLRVTEVPHALAGRLSA